MHFRIHGMLNKISAIQKGLETIHTTTPTQTAQYLAQQTPASPNVSSNLSPTSPTLDSPTSLGVPDNSYPGISRSPSPFTPGEDKSAPLEDLKNDTGKLDLAGLCNNLKVT